MEAVWGSLFWKGYDISEVVQSESKYKELGIGFVDKVLKKMHQKRVNLAILNINEEMKEIKHLESPYLDQTRLLFVKTLVDNDSNYSNIEEVVGSINNTKLRYNTSIEVCRDLIKTGKMDVADIQDKVSCPSQSRGSMG